jgi:hypothetical protein
LIHKLAITALVLGVVALGMVFVAPETESWRVAEIVVTIGAAGLFVALLVYRIIWHDAGKGTLTEILSEGEE